MTHKYSCGVSVSQKRGNKHYGSSLTEFRWVWCSLGRGSRYSLEKVACSFPKSSASFRCRRRQKTKSSFAALCWRKRKRNIRNIIRCTDVGEDEDPFEKAVTALTNYFTPKTNREYEVYVFRKAKQESDESISEFHTRLRRLAMICEFANTDREIETQIV